MNSKKHEIEYVNNLTLKEKDWLLSKPFGDYNLKESFLRIRDFSYIVELLKLDEGKKIALLDLGCGSGWTSIMLAKLGVKVTAADISPDMIKIAKENAEKESLAVKFMVSDIEKGNFKNTFDRVLIYDALHHCPKEERVLRNAFQALKRGGLLLLVEPNIKHQKDVEAQKIAKRFGVLEKGFTPKYLKKQMKKIGFREVTRFHCNYGVNKPSPEGFSAFLKHLGRLIIIRLFLANYQSQVWISARK